MKVNRAITTILALAVLVTVFASLSAMADEVIYTDPANLHVGTGYGTPCAQGCGADPNVIGTGSNFSIYYNTQGNGNLPIGDPLYLIYAIPVYAGSSSANSAPSTAQWYNPAAPSTNVTVDSKTYVNGTPMTSGDIYAWMGYADQQNNSFSFVNMVACDVGTSSGSNKCPNTSLQGSGAPLAGKTITGYDIYTYQIHLTDFGPGDTLNFTGGSLPIGSYVAALGVDCTTANRTTSCECWSVPFTESGIITQQTPEPASLMLLGAGLLGLGGMIRRKK